VVTQALRVRKARRRAREASEQAEQLLERYSAKVDPAKVAEVRASLEALREGSERGDVVAIYEHLKALDGRVAEHFSRFKKSATRELIESVGVAVGIALLVRAFVFEAFTIPSGSMIPTLAVGDFLFVNKLSYGIRIPFTLEQATHWAEPKRGEVVVFLYPCNPTQDFIKRVVGLPGDVINVVNRNNLGFVTINGEPVAEVPNGPFQTYAQFETNHAEAAALASRRSASRPSRPLRSTRACARQSRTAGPTDLRSTGAPLSRPRWGRRPQTSSRSLGSSLRDTSS
jgi:signal peptidase I